MFQLTMPFSTAQGKVPPVAVLTPYTLGIDVADHQHKQAPINWPLVAKSGPRYVVVKATEGVHYANKYYKDDYQAAQDNGLVRGTYHFARPSEATGAQEADFLLNHLGALSIGDFIAFDTEDRNVSSVADLLAHTLDFLTHVEIAVGFKPMIYSGDWYMKDHNLEKHFELANYGLWYAAYQDGLPIVPAPWQYWAMWQYTSFGVVPGIRGPVDMNLFNGSIDQLKLYGKRAA